MKYALLFPKAKKHDEPVPGLVYFDPLMDCFVCHEQTHFADIVQGVGVCSEECALKLREGHRESRTAV